MIRERQIMLVSGTAVAAIRDKEVGSGSKRMLGSIFCIRKGWYMPALRNGFCRLGWLIKKEGNVSHCSEGKQRFQMWVGSTGAGWKLEGRTVGLMWTLGYVTTQIVLLRNQMLIQQTKAVWGFSPGRSRSRLVSHISIFFAACFPHLLRCWGKYAAAIWDFACTE